MASKFRLGAYVYTRDGRRYVVEEVDGGIVYCSADSGAETEFPEAQLLTEAEWRTKSDGKREDLYPRLKQAQPYTTAPRVERAAAERLIDKVTRLAPSLLDFAAYETAAGILADQGDSDLVAGLSIVKCRAVFDSAAPPVRAGILARFLSVTAEALVGAAGLGDNLMRAMLDKGLASHADAYEAFQGRRRQ